MEKMMRVLTPDELAMMTRTELDAMLRHIAQQLPYLPVNSPELRTAQANLQAIRRQLTAPPRPNGLGPRPF
jgi:hypothetical protein